MANPVLDGYDPGAFWCEMSNGGTIQSVRDRLAALPLDDLKRRAANADAELRDLGITFTVYSERDAADRVLPFDCIPRVLSAEDWARIEAGVCQRVAALNHLLHDIYHDQKILADGVIPADLILGNANYRPIMRGVDLPHRTYVNVCGTDIVRDSSGGFMVLEDNARTPSGVGYVVENRHMMLRSFPDMLEGVALRPVADYGGRLLEALREVAPPGAADPQVVLLSPGPYNSAYFEHVFLAREMGVPLVEGRDLVVEDDRVWMRTTGGLARVETIYRRVDDDFLDPEAFRPDSGLGLADDQAVYAYMPRAIRYYLDQDPILPNVETHICREPEALQYTLDHLEELVIKPVGEAGGYGITIGPRASWQEIADCRAKLVADPANYISQPCISLSVAPTLWARRSSRAMSTSGPLRSPGQARGCSRAGSRAWRCAKALWWSTRRKAAAPRTRGSL